MMDGTEIIIVVMVLIGFVIFNYRTPVVEGAKFNINKIGKNLKKQANNAIKTVGKEANKGVNYAKDLLKKDEKSGNTTPAPIAAASVAAASAVASDTNTPQSIEVPLPISAAAETPLPVDFKEVQGYLDKIKKYSNASITMSDSVSSTAEEYKKAFTDATDQLTKLSGEVASNTSKAEDAAAKAVSAATSLANITTDIQANVNSNNIIKNEIGAKIIEMREIEKNVLGYAIDASMSAYNAKESAAKSEKALAGILPTSTNNNVLKLGFQNIGSKVEGFTGFKSSILEGYTVFSDPNLPGGSQGTSAMDLENSLVEKINVFNQVYYGYLSETIKPGTTTKYSIADVNAARSELNTAISALNTQIGVIGSTTPKITDASFNNNHTSIKTTAAQIETLRSDLDMKMQEILKAKEGIPADHNIKHDTAAYTTILWTALATSVLYFVFVKIE